MKTLNKSVKYRRLKKGSGPKKHYVYKAGADKAQIIRESNRASKKTASREIQDIWLNGRNTN